MRVFVNGVEQPTVIHGLKVLLHTQILLYVLSDLRFCSFTEIVTYMFFMDLRLCLILDIDIHIHIHIDIHKHTNTYT